MDTEQRQQRPVERVADIHWAVEFWQPKFHAVSYKYRQQVKDLIGEKGTFVFAHNDCVQGAIGAC